MDRVVFAVDVMRCHQCQQLIDPRKPFYQRQMKTAVEVGVRVGQIERYEMVNVCEGCNAFLNQVEAEDRISRWWTRFWITAVCAAFIGSFFSPHPMAVLYTGIVLRLAWKWGVRRRRTQRALPMKPTPSD